MNYNIPKRQHKFLIGPKGAYLQELLESTKCSLELSPTLDTVVIRGPNDQLAPALTYVSGKVCNVISLDIAHTHKLADKPLEHAKNILKYLINRSKLRKIETDFNVQIIIPKGQELEKEVVLELIGKNSKDAKKARDEVQEIVKNLVCICQSY